MGLKWHINSFCTALWLILLQLKNVTWLSIKHF